MAPGGDDARPGPRRHRPRGLFVDVRDHQPGAGGVELVGEVSADVADTLDRHGHAVQVAVEGAAHAEPDAAKHALGSDRTGVAGRRRMPLQPGHIAGALARVH